VYICAPNTAAVRAGASTGHEPARRVVRDQENAAGSRISLDLVLSGARLGIACGFAEPRMRMSGNGIAETAYYLKQQVDPAGLGLSRALSPAGVPRIGDSGQNRTQGGVNGRRIGKDAGHIGIQQNHNLGL